MKDHNNLDDLIIDSTESKPKSNAKSILTTIVLIIIVLIIAIFSTKILLKEPEKSPLANDQNYTQRTNPDLQLETNNTIKNDTNSTVDNSSGPSVSKSQSMDNNTTSTKTIDNTTNQKPIEIKKNIQQNNTLPVTQKPQVKNIETKKETTINEIYFVQVGSFTSKPNEAFLSIIKNSEYNYQVKTVKNGKITITKFLIGPYNGREKAESALAEIRKHINKSAFLVK